MSKFLNVLLAFRFLKLINKQEKLIGGKDTLLATPKGACGCPGLPSVDHLGKKYSKFIRYDILPLKFLKSPKKQESYLSPATH